MAGSALREKKTVSVVTIGRPSCRVQVRHWSCSTGLAIQDFAIARAAVEDAAGLDLPPLEP